MKRDLLISMASFRNYGGWRLDTQFVSNMGVPYLLAHGLGQPVADAETTVCFPQAAAYHVYIYTFNWVSPWKKDQAPGRFRVRIGGREPEVDFGTVDHWGWEYGGVVTVPAGEQTVVLHDLTGFEGRCGLIYLSMDSVEALPEGPEAVRAFYREKLDCLESPIEGRYDLAVCGGGIAGICTALSASRQGVETVLIQDRPVVGGNNSSEVRVWLGGKTNFAPLPGVGNIVNELEQSRVGHYGPENQGENYEDGKKLELLRREKHARVLLNHIVVNVHKAGDCIRSVEVWDICRNRFFTLEASLFADTTGDATVGYLADADYEVTTNGHMGMTNVWYVEDTGEAQAFPACPWAIDLRGVDFPGKPGVSDVYGGKLEKSLGCWFWESGCELDPIEKAEYARDLNFRAMYGAWDCLKNTEGAYPTYRLGYCAYIGGKRESRRLFGDVVLTKSEVSKAVSFPDGCVPSTWSFDVHYPDRRFYSAFREGDGFITKDYHERFPTPFFIPYRCLYSRNVRNLFMAGRNISVSHDALGTARVMRTGGMMGEVVGFAAALCKKYDALPGDLYREHLEELMDTLKNIPEKKLNPLVSNV